MGSRETDDLIGACGYCKPTFSILEWALDCRMANGRPLTAEDVPVLDSCEGSSRCISTTIKP